MCEESDKVLEGAPVGPVAECSLGEYLVEKMRSLPQERVIQVDADTGAVQTVREVLEMGVGLSEGLRKVGLRENDVVGLLCRNSFEASAVVLGCWLSGATVCPIGHGMKVGELRHAFGVTRPRFIFCDEDAVSNVCSAMGDLSPPATVVVVGCGKGCGGPHLAFEDVIVEADVDRYRARGVADPGSQLVGILFSSGTFGLPKGVGITHRNLIFQDMNMKGLMDFEDMKSFLQVSHFFWVTGVLVFLRSLTTGIKRVLVREATVANLLKAMERYKTDSTLVAPAVAVALVSSPEFESIDAMSMKMIFVGGSLLTRVMSDRIREKWKSVRLIHLYGTTECTGTISFNDGGNEPVSVGKVSPGVRVKVVDADTGRAVKANCPGEICVKSPGIMKGYVRNEEATREAMDSEGWYHTGDLGRYDDEGQLFIVGRMKEIVKIRSNQVSPVEVENTILEVPGVAEAAVEGVTSDGSLYHLMAFVVKTKDSTVTEEDIHAHVAATLSETKKLTAGIHFVEGIPKTPNGKLHRKEINKRAQMLYSGTGR